MVDHGGHDRESTDGSGFGPSRGTIRFRHAVGDLRAIEAPGGTVDPVVLTTDDGARAIAIRLEAGQELSDHQVRERAWVIVVEGRAEIRSGDQLVDGVVGTLVTFEPGERHAVSSAEGARVLLILAPWPGPGHYPGGETS